MNGIAASPVAGLPGPPAPARTKRCRPRGRVARLVVLAALLAGLGAGAHAGPAEAAPVVSVTTTADVTNAGDGVTSLREALSAAQYDDEATTVNLPANATFSLTDCAQGALSYSDVESITVNGNGSTIDQTCPGHRVMTLSTPDQPVTLNGLTITGGSSGANDGGGVWVNAPLTITNSRFVDNHADGGDAEGGALRAMKSILVSNTVFTQNSAYRGGAISSVGNAHLTRVAVVDNEADLTGGVEVSGNGTTLTLVTSTVSGNHGTAHVTGGAYAPNITLRNATVSGNTGTGGTATQLYAPGTLTSSRSVVAAAGPGTSNCVASTKVSQGWNYADSTACGFSPQSGDLALAGSAGLTAAADNGGNTLTALPTVDSLLVDAIPVANCDMTYVNDQRNVVRPQGDGCDVGAAELEIPPVFCAGLEVTVDLADGDAPTAGPDVIRGTPGADTVNGLGGDDRFCGLGGNDTFTGGPGNDRAFGGQGADVLRGSAGNDVLDGGNGNDRAYGQLGRDTLRGLSGNDVLEGGGGNDVHIGGPHRDTCRGQAGRDQQSGCEIRTGFP